MGKRELVLIGVFVLLGIGVYQFTAPPPAPGSEGISLSSIFQSMKRGVHGSRESATVDSQGTVPCDPSVRELRINIPRTSDITVIGEDREDVASEFHVTARGFDQAEAKAAAHGITLKAEQVGDALVVSIVNAAARSGGRNNGPSEMVVALRVPRRLALRMEPHSGRLVAENLLSAEIMGSRGETRLKKFSGRVVLTHSGGELDVEDLASFKLNSRNSHGTVKQVAGTMAVDAIGGDLTFTGIIGPLEVEARNTDLRLDDLKGLKVPLRINSTGGDLRVDGLRSEARLDGRNTNMEIALAAAAPITVYNLGEIRITAPPDGYTLDAAATEGHITVADGGIQPTEGADPRATGPVRGGGPTLTLRTTRGSITVTKPSAGK